MKIENKKIPAIFLSAMLVCTMSGCRQEENGREMGAEESTAQSGHATASTVTLTEGKYSEEKLVDTWDEKTAVYFTLENDKISVGENGGSGDDADILKGKAEITESGIVISKEGTYVFSGTLADGQIIVDADKEETVRLVFQGVELNCGDSAPVYSKGGNVIITLADGTENTVEDGSAYTFEQEGDDEPGAAIFAKDDLTFNGNGTLKVTGNYNHAIQCKDDLKFVSGAYIISAANDGIVGKDSVTVRDGNFTIESADDGIKATNTEETDKGYILIENGDFLIQAAGDGIQAETLLRVNDGTFEITAGGGSQNAEAVSGTPEEMGKMMPEGRGEGKTSGEKSGDRQGMEDGNQRMPSQEMQDKSERRMNPQDDGAMEGEMTPPDGMEMPKGGDLEGETPPDGMEMPKGGDLEGEMTPPDGMEMPKEGAMEGEMAPPGGRAGLTEEGNTGNTESTAESVSTKGLKSYVELIIAGGEFNLDTQDDGIHSDQNVTIQGGGFVISTGDDGIHADQTLTVDGGSLDIQKSYEGLEAFDIVINDGDINIISSDDGINAAGDDDSAKEPETSGAGGRNHFMADENQGASMTINGGAICVNADGDGLDANGDIFINGGMVTVHGPANGGNGTLDYAASCKITGGTFTGVGSIGMAQDPSGDSTQASIVLRTDSIIDAGTTISLKDKDGNVLAETATVKNAQWFALSSPELTAGETYTFCAGTTEKEVIPTQTVTQFTF